jgi:hypothetical protein
MRLNRRNRIALCCALPLLVQACGPVDDARAPGDRPPAIVPVETPPRSTAAAPGDDAGSHMLIGRLQSVDPERGTLRIRTSDGHFKVSVTADTEIVSGGQDVQGLAPIPGGHLTVYYHPSPDGDGRTALRIETR